MDALHQGILTLIRSAVSGQKMALPEDFSLEGAFRLICKQHLVTMAYLGGRNCGLDGESAGMQQLFSLYYELLLRSEKQMLALNRLFDAFEAEGIDYLPLKGCKLKQMYPKPELRYMGDGDILIRMEQYERIKPILRRLGYKSKGETHHELVWHSEQLHLELHKCLFAPSHKEYYGYFGDGWKIARRAEGYRFELKPEDMYVYLFVHMTKHYRYSGVGCRYILDLQVYRERYPELDEAYIEGAMRGLHLLEFYQNIRKLMGVWFEDQQPDEKTEYISRYIFRGGSWGNSEDGLLAEAVNRTVASPERKYSRAKTIWQAVFPPLEKLQLDYPVLFRHPWIYPLFWVPRWIRGILCRPRQIIKKAKIVRGITGEQLDERIQAFRYVGLEFEFDENQD